MEKLVKRVVVIPAFNEAKNIEALIREVFSSKKVILYYCLQKGFSVKEIPIFFEDRRQGKSKLTLRILLNLFFFDSPVSLFTGFQMSCYPWCARHISPKKQRQFSRTVRPTL